MKIVKKNYRIPDKLLLGLGNVPENFPRLNSRVLLCKVYCKLNNRYRHIEETRVTKRLDDTILEEKMFDAAARDWKRSDTTFEKSYTKKSFYRRSYYLITRLRGNRLELDERNAVDDF